MNKMVQSAVIHNVCLASAEQAKKQDYGKIDLGVCRRGTCCLSIHDIGAKFGEPHESNFTEDGIDGAGKVHARWFISTPRGLVGIHDYWWNGENELSISAGNNHAARWATYWLRSLGIKAGRRVIA